MNIFSFIKAKICPLHSSFRTVSHVNKSSLLVLLYFLALEIHATSLKTLWKDVKCLGWVLRTRKGFPNPFKHKASTFKIQIYVSIANGNLRSPFETPGVFGILQKSSCVNAIFNKEGALVHDVEDNLFSCYRLSMKKKFRWWKMVYRTASLKWKLWSSLLLPVS